MSLILLCVIIHPPIAVTVLLTPSIKKMQE